MGQPGPDVPAGARQLRPRRFPRHVHGRHGRSLSPNRAPSRRWRRRRGAVTTIVVVGTGRLATAVAHALALLADGRARPRLVVAGRDRERVDWLAAATAARAHAAG